jgi:hypothetical protein
MKKWICRFIGHQYSVWMMFDSPHEKGIVYVCSRCDKVAGDMTFPCGINFDELEPYEYKCKKHTRESI